MGNNNSKVIPQKQNTKRLGEKGWIYQPNHHQARDNRLRKYKRITNIGNENVKIGKSAVENQNSDSSTSTVASNWTVKRPKYMKNLSKNSIFSDSTASVNKPPFLKNQSQTSIVSTTSTIASQMGHSSGGNFFKKKKQSVKSEKARALKRIASYCPTQLLVQLGKAKELEKPVPTGQKVYAVICFIDISGFTEISQKLKAESITKHINNYFERVIQLAKAYGGDVEKFAGDAAIVMFYYSVTDPSKPPTRDQKVQTILRACVCAKKITNLHYKIISNRMKSGNSSTHLWLNKEKLESPEDETSSVGSSGLYRQPSQSKKLSIYSSTSSFEEFLNRIAPTEDMNLLLSNDDKIYQQLSIKLKKQLDELKKKQKNTIHIELESHCAIGIGSFYIQHVGGIQNQWKRIILSQTFQEIGPALTSASKKQVVITKKAYQLIRHNIQASPCENTDDFLLERIKVRVRRSPILQVKLNPKIHAGWMRYFVDSYIAQRVSIGKQDATINVIKKVTAAFIKIELHSMSKEVTVLQKIIERTQILLRTHDGTIGNFLMDEKSIILVLIFGHPMQHVDDPKRAVLTTTNLISNFKHIKAVGIATGDVFIGAVGSKERRDYTIMGSKINLAARLMASALPGEILACEKSAAAIESEYNLDHLPPKMIKGFKYPMHYVKIIGIKVRKKEETNDSLKEVLMRDRIKEKISDYIDNWIEQPHKKTKCLILRGITGVGHSLILKHIHSKYLSKFPNYLMQIYHCEDIGQSNPFESIRASFQDWKDLIPRPIYLQLENKSSSIWIDALCILIILNHFEERYEGFIYFFDSIDKLDQLSLAVCKLMMGGHKFNMPSIHSVYIDSVKPRLLIFTHNRLQHLHPTKSLLAGSHISEEEFNDGVLKFQTMIKPRVRVYKFRIYRNVFLGKNAVTLINTLFNCDSTEDAIVIGNVMIERKVFEHVTKDHLLKNQAFFYRILHHEYQRPRIEFTMEQFLRCIPYKSIHIKELTRAHADLFICQKYHLKICPPELLNFVHSISMGLPKFICLIMDQLLLQNIISIHDQLKEVQIKGIIELVSIPPCSATIQNTIDKLDRNASYIAKIAATFHEPFDIEMIQIACPTQYDDGSVLRHLATLIKTNMLTKYDDRYEFTLPIYRYFIKFQTPQNLIREVDGRLGLFYAQKYELFSEESDLIQSLQHFTNSNCVNEATRYAGTAINIFKTYLGRYQSQCSLGRTQQLYALLESIIVKNNEDDEFNEDLIQIAVKICKIEEEIGDHLLDAQHISHVSRAFDLLPENHQSHLTIYFENWRIRFRDKDIFKQQSIIEMAEEIASSPSDEFFINIMKTFLYLQTGKLDLAYYHAKVELDKYYKNPIDYHMMSIQHFIRINFSIVFHYCIALISYYQQDREKFKKTLIAWKRSLDVFAQHEPSVCIHETLLLNLEIQFITYAVFDSSHTRIVNDFAKILHVIFSMDTLESPNSFKETFQGNAYDVKDTSMFSFLKQDASCLAHCENASIPISFRTSNLFNLNTELKSLLTNFKRISQRMKSLSSENAVDILEELTYFEICVHSFIYEKIDNVSGLLFQLYQGMQKLLLAIISYACQIHHILDGLSSFSVKVEKILGGILHSQERGYPLYSVNELELIMYVARIRHYYDEHGAKETFSELQNIISPTQWKLLKQSLDYKNNKI